MDAFEENRGLMFAIAYRMLGSAMEAEDIVQEAYIRFSKVDATEIREPKHYLSTIVTRLCLNQIQSAAHQRESYLGPWLPEPIATSSHQIWSDVSKRIVEAESISMAFMVLLESLTPLERAVFILREVFDYPYEEIAKILGKNEIACRKILSRAKKHIENNKPRYNPSPQAHQNLLENFFSATERGDIAGLMNILSDEIMLWADGGGKVKGAAIHPIHGRESVARFILGVSERIGPEGGRIDFTEINGDPAAILYVGDVPFVVITADSDAGKITALRLMANPDKLNFV